MRGFNIFAPPPKEIHTVEVWEENWPAVMFFLYVDTQWRRAGQLGVKVGLDYPAVFQSLDRVHRDKTVEQRDEIFADLQVLERAALQEMAEQAKQ